VSKNAATGGAAGAAARSGLWMFDAAGICACAVATLVAYAGALAPVMRAQERTRAQEAELAGLRDDLARADAELRQTDTTLDRALTNEHGALTLKPVGEINQRLAALTGLATELELSIQEVQPGTPVPGPRFDVVPIHIGGSGRFSGCVAFMHRIRQEFRDIGISGFHLSGNPAEPTAPTGLVLDLAWCAAPAAGATRK
jgi:hypothetical protein